MGGVRSHQWHRRQQNLIRVAVARDPRQALPLWGTFEGAATDALDMTVSVETREIRAGKENSGPIN